MPSLDLFIICALSSVVTFAILTATPYTQHILSHIILYLDAVGAYDSISTFLCSVLTQFPINIQVDARRPLDTHDGRHPPAPFRPTRSTHELQGIASAAVAACRTAFPDDFEAVIRTATFIFVVAGLVREDADVVLNPDMVDEMTKSFDELERCGRPPTTSLMSSLRRMTLDHPDGPDPLELVFPIWKALRKLVGHIHGDEPARLAFQTLYSNTVSRLSIEAIMSQIMHRYSPLTPTHPRRSSIASIFCFPARGDGGDDIEAARRTRLWASPANGYPDVTEVQVAAGLILAEILSEVDRG